MNRVRVFAADPGLAHFGWAVLEFGNSQRRVLRAGVVRTKPEARRRRSYEMGDRRRRLNDIRESLLETIAAFHPDLGAMEEVSAPRSSAASLMLGMAATAFETLLWVRGIPVITHLPQDVRQRLALPRNASKDSVRAAVGGAIQIDGLRIVGAETAAAQHHHAIDAIAAGLAAADHVGIAKLRRDHGG